MTGSETIQLLLATAVAGDKRTKEETLLLPADVKLSLPLHILSPITQAEAITWLFSSLAISHYTHTQTPPPPHTQAVLWSFSSHSRLCPGGCFT